MGNITSSSCPIGVIDSGSGGLSILESIIKLCPSESTVYIGDHANLPYGEKTKGFIRIRIKKIIDYLIRTYRIKLVVIACNSATVAGITVYRKQFPTIPIIGVVPVIKTAAFVSVSRRICIFSTLFTSRSSYQKKLIRMFAGDCTVMNIGCIDLIRRIENGDTNSAVLKTELKTLLAPVHTSKADVLVLGCTHFPFIIQAIRETVGDSVTILDSGGAVSRRVQAVLNAMKLVSQNKISDAVHLYFTSSDASAIVSRAASFLVKRSISFKHVEI